MLSVILYGRNDSHGYNLHKRVAISLNCMAHVLTDADEIIFVDFNTPDEFPTLPEALADTLTADARRRLRVLRVRPRQFQPWRDRTHLPVLEPLARNVALRRCNPANRWVLSTNTDMVFIPPQPGADLGGAVAGLADGIYHMPRYEVPEGVWERFDRFDPAQVLTDLGRIGRELHLPEIVAGSPPALFDNHGDFQLVPRAWLEDVDGFDERMLFGWIVDSNLSRRLELRRGAAAAFDPAWAGYHCDHTRRPGQFHGRRHVENDFRRFVLGVARADLPHQRDVWGLAGQEIEEIRLTDQDCAIACLTSVSAPPPARPPASVYAPEIFDRPHYPLDHVLPYVCDLLAPQHRGARIAWFGGRARMAQSLAAAMQAMGFVHPLLTDDEAAALDQADLFVFEFGAPDQDAGRQDDSWSAGDLEKLARVRQILFRLVEAERANIAAGRPARLVIVVNAVHNRFEAAVHDCLAVARDPFSTRLRHGRVLAPDPSPWTSWTPGAVAAWLQKTMGRPDVPITEAVRLITYVEALRDGRLPEGGADDIGRAAGVVLRVLDYPALGGRSATAAALVESVRPGRGGAIATPVASSVDAATGFTGSARWEDWDDPAWVAVARRYFGGAFAANCFRRTPSVWRSVHVVRRVLALATGGRPPHVVVAATRPDAVWDVLSEIGCMVAVIDCSDRGDLSQAPFAGIRAASRLRFCRPDDDLGDDLFDFALSLAGTDCRLPAGRVRPGGVSATEFFVDVAAPAPPPAPPGWRDDRTAPFAWSEFSLDAFIRCADDGRALMPGLWFFHREQP